MKKIALLVSCLFTLVTMAMADNVGPIKRGGFPQSLMPVSQQTMGKPAKTVVNTDKDLGLEMYAVSLVDPQNDPCFFRFWTNNAYDWDRIFIVEPDRDVDPYRIQIMMSGTLKDGYYYGYAATAYTWVTYPKAFVKIDVKTGEVEYLQDMSSLKDSWNAVDAMSVNPKTGEMWATARTSDESGNARSMLGKIDMKTGEFTKVCTLNDWYPGMSIDMDGNIWAVRWNWSSNNELNGSRLVKLDPENNYAESVALPMTSEGKELVLYYTNSIDFDRTTGDLYGVLTDTDPNTGSGYQKLFKINTSTGALTYKASVSGSISGLAIPYRTADAREAAAKVENLTSTPGEDGKTITLTWTNPSTAWNGDALADLAEVKIYRNSMDNEIASVDATGKVGKQMSWTDENPESGLQTYYVVPCRVAGEKGVSESWNAFGGKDTPGAPENVYLNTEGNALVLSWEPAKLGANDGWYDKANTKYTVTRLPDEKVVAKDITETTLKDEDFGAQMAYSYIIEPSNGEGVGTSTTSIGVVAGNAYSLPYDTKFMTADEASAWTAVDNNHDGQTFKYYSYDNYFDVDPYGFQLYTDYVISSDDYALSPKVTLEAGKKYRATFDCRFQYAYDTYHPDCIHNFEFTVGPGTTAADQTTVLASYKNFQLDPPYYQVIPFELYFTPETSGDYNFGWHVTTDGSVTDVLRLVHARIEEVFDNDLKATALVGPLNPTNGAETEYTVNVLNNGNNTIDNYKVQVVRLDGDNKVVLGEKEVTTPLASLTSTEVKVMATPDVEGEALFAGVVVLNNDQDTSNDTTNPLTVVVAKAGTMAFNALLTTNENTSSETRIPVSFTKRYSTVESVYYPSDFQEKPEGTLYIHRLGYEYDANDDYTLVENANIKVYLTTTSKVKFSGSDWGNLFEPTELYKPEDMTKVFESTFSSKPGTGNMMTFEFDEPFAYDTNTNLVVCIVKDGVCEENQYPLTFKAYDNHSDLAVSDVAEVYRTLRAESANAEYDFSTSKGYGYFLLTQVPVMQLAVSDNIGSGITNIVAGKGIAYMNGNLMFNGINASQVAVYNLTGSTLANRSLANGTSSINMPLAPGVYVVKVVDNNGKTFTKKIQILK